MRWRWLPPSILFFLAACAGSCAGPTNGVENPPPPSTGPTKSYVAVDGDDAADGSEATPFRTLGRALDADRDVIVVRPGTYAEPEVVVTRRVRIEGDPSGRATLDGHLLVSGNDVHVARLDVRGGVAITLAERVTVETATISYGVKDDAVSVASSLATLKDLSLDCGLETCVQVTTSTAILDGLELSSDIATKRGVRVDSASVAASRITVTGLSIAQVQVGGPSSLVVRDAELRGALGNGLVALDGAKLLAERVTVTGADRFAVLARSADATVRDSRLGASRSITAGVQAGTARFVSTIIDGSPEGTLSVTPRSDDAPTVRVEGGEIRQGAHFGVAHSGGTLAVVGTRFIGDDTAPVEVDDRDAIVATGMGTHLVVDRATFERPAGAAIFVTNHASATITATITAPRTTGIIIETSRVEPTRIFRVRIDDCVRESGIAVFDSELVTIEDARISGCAEAGLLTGDEAVVSARRVVALDNPGFGFAAFGGAQLEVVDSRAQGSQWATFATCADGARVLDGGGNLFKGATADCP